jgi:hypothetical protein
MNTSVFKLHLTLELLWFGLWDTDSARKSSNGVLNTQTRIRLNLNCPGINDQNISIQHCNSESELRAVPVCSTLHCWRQAGDVKNWRNLLPRGSLQRIMFWGIINFDVVARLRQSGWVGAWPCGSMTKLPQTLRQSCGSSAAVFGGCGTFAMPMPIDGRVH